MVDHLYQRPFYSHVWQAGKLSCNELVHTYDMEKGYGGKQQMVVINSLTQTRTHQLIHVAQPYHILGTRAYRTCGILAEQPGNQFWTQKQPFQVHIFDYLTVTIMLVGATFQAEMMIAI